MKRRFLLCTAICLTLLCSLVFCFAAEPDAGGSTTPSTAPLAVSPLVLILISVIAPIITGAIKTIAPRLPKWSLPIITILQGVIAGLASSPDVIGAALGAIGGGAGIGNYELKKQLSIKTGTLSLAFACLIPIAFVACSTISDQQVSQIQNITRGVVQSAVTIELSALPKHRPYIEASLKQVNDCIAQGAVTATTLGAIVNALPVSPDAIRYTTTGLLVYDGLSFLWLTPASDRALRAMADGIKIGLERALAAVPANAKARPGALAAAIEPVPVPPAPRWEDDPKSGAKKNVIPVR